jgi:site-specific DNA-methyltransferase (adenine-specific)
MKPYFEANGVTIYHGDCREILPTLDPASVDLVLTDPPYGINLDTANHSRGRSRHVHASGSRPKQAPALASDYAPVYGDAEPYDPSILFGFKRLVLFGANHFAQRLPESPSWIVWDKTAGLIAKKRAIGICDNADAELIWTNLGGPVRILGHQWLGLMKATERGDARVHPTQKPVALMRWLIDMYSKADDLILDPYMGSGTTLRAAIDQGRRAIGCEVEEAYCEIAARRCEQSVLFGASA